MPYRPINYTNHFKWMIDNIKLTDREADGEAILTLMRNAFNCGKNDSVYFPKPICTYHGLNTGNLDSHLIEAAPELLNACRKVVELRALIEYGDVSESNQDEALATFRLISMCESAINKALGTSI